MLVLLYVLDSLRHDFVGCINPDEDNTPHLDALTSDGVVFTRAYAQATWTKASGGSLLTGMYPHAVGCDERASRIHPESFLLLHALASRGFHRICISAAPFISAEFGFDRGFDVLVNAPELPEFQARPRRGRIPIVTSSDLNTLIEQYLPASDEHVCILVWNMDTHHPYIDLPRYEREGVVQPDIHFKKLPQMDQSYLRDLYRSTITYADRHIGQLMNTLKRRGLYDEALIIVTGDHGESFGERNQYSHSGLPFDEQIHVPLIIKRPGRQDAGAVRSDFVQLTDILPTILKSAGDATDRSEIQGQDVFGDVLRSWAYAAHETSPLEISLATVRTERAQYFRLCRPRFNLKAVFTEAKRLRRFNRPITRWLRIPYSIWYAVRVQLSWLQNHGRGSTGEWYFDLTRDPHALHNVADQAGAALDEPRNILNSIERQNDFLVSQWSSESTSVDIEGILEERLRSLGYIE